MAMDCGFSSEGFICSSQLATKSPIIAVTPASQHPHPPQDVHRTVAQISALHSRDLLSAMAAFSRLFSTGKFFTGFGRARPSFPSDRVTAHVCVAADGAPGLLGALRSGEAPPWAKPRTFIVLISLCNLILIWAHTDVSNKQ